MVTENTTCAYSIEIPIRWSDMDAYNHVNNSIYLTYFEQARIDWLKQIVPSDMELNASNAGPVIINATCTFLKAIQFPETIIVKMFLNPPGRSSFECFYEIISKNQPNITYATGSTKVVWIDRCKMQSIPLPDYIKKYLPQ